MRIRIGVLGSANIAVRSLIPEILVHPGFELVAIASRSAERAKELAQRYSCRPMSYEEMVSSALVDAVYVPLPTGLHASWVLRCLDNGKHVLCEKSLACNLEEVRDIVNKARQRNLAVVETFQFRFHQQNVATKGMLGAGEIGHVRNITASFGFPPFREAQGKNIRYDKELGGGALLDAGAYTIKVLSYLLPSAWRVCGATLWTPRDAEVDWWGAALLENQAGTTATVTFGFDHYYQCQYEVWGSSGKITVKRAFTAPPTLTGEVLCESGGESRRVEIPPDNHFRNLLDHFVFCVVGEKKADEYDECVRQAELIEQVARAAELNSSK